MNTTARPASPPPARNSAPAKFQASKRSNPAPARADASRSSAPDRTAQNRAPQRDVRRSAPDATRSGPQQFQSDSRQPGNRNFSEGNSEKKPAVESPILFQSYFKSIGPRTYAAQLKEASNGNHFLVLTEGRRDAKSGEVWKTRLFVFSEDFEAFFKMIHETAEFIEANPVPEEVRQKRARFWAKNREADAAPCDRDAEGSSAE